MGKGYKLCSGGGSISSSASYDTKNNIPHNADMLGRKYTAEDIDKLNQNLEKLGGFEPVIDDSTGKITGYKTTIGGADTVFPFSSSGEFNVVLVNSGSLTGSGDWMSKAFSVNCEPGTYYMFLLTAEVDEYQRPISGVSISNVDNIFAELKQSPERQHSSFYTAIVKTTSNSITVTINSGVAATDRQYRWALYQLFK